MQDASGTKRLVTIALFAAAIGAAVLGYNELFGKRPPSPPPTATGPAQAAPGSNDAATPGGDGPDASAPPSPATLASRRATERTATLETPEFRATVSDLNGGLRSFVLKGHRYAGPGADSLELVTTDKERFYPMRLLVGGVRVPPDARWTLEQLSPTAVRASLEVDGFRLERKLEAGRGPYQIWSTDRVTNLSRGPRPVRIQLATSHYVLSEESKGSFFGARSPRQSAGVCIWGDDPKVTRLAPEVGGGRPFPDGFLGHGYGPGVRVAGVENTYFANAMAADSARAEQCVALLSPRYVAGSDEPHGTVFDLRLAYARRELAPAASEATRTLLYFGPKETEALAAAGHALPSVVDLGWFSPIARGLVRLLGFIHGGVGNWGIAIILMTILVRIVFFPLTIKSFQSMARMRLLKPEMDRINELYANDREKKGAAVMELYRKHKINPLGGCLPQLLQMPVWFAFYASLSTNIELHHTPFVLFWTDLSARDPYFILPLTLGVLMFLQQKMTPTTMDPAQAKMMLYFMPVMITSFMLFLPAGLCLYMVTNSVLGIAQQHWIQRRQAAAAGGGAPPVATAATAPASPGGAAPLPTTDESEKMTPRPWVHSKRRNRRG